MDTHKVTKTREKHTAGTVILSLGNWMAFVASSLRSSFLGWRLFVFFFTIPLPLEIFCKYPLEYLPLSYLNNSLWRVKSIYRKRSRDKWNTPKYYWKKYREISDSLEVWHYQPSLTAHSFVYTSLQLWRQHTAYWSPRSFRELGICYMGGPTLGPTNLLN